MKSIFESTLSKTCRILANNTRLDLLRTLLKNGEMNVGEIAKEHDLSDQVASHLLRELNRSGLIQSQQRSRWVYHQTNPSTPQGALLLYALKESFRTHKTNSEICHIATAFTYYRRIELLQELRSGPTSLEQLHLKTEISLQALYRHLDKLKSRDFIHEEHPRIYSIHFPKELLALTLLQMALP